MIGKRKKKARDGNVEAGKCTTIVAVERSTSPQLHLLCPKLCDNKYRRCNDFMKSIAVG